MAMLFCRSFDAFSMPNIIVAGLRIFLPSNGPLLGISFLFYFQPLWTSVRGYEVTFISHLSSVIVISFVCLLMVMYLYTFPKLFSYVYCAIFVPPRACTIEGK